MNESKSSRFLNVVRVKSVMGALCIAGFTGMTAPLVAQDILTTQSDHVVFQCDFEQEAWWEAWGLNAQPPRVETVSQDAELGFISHDRQALRIRVDEDGHYGLSLQYRFAKQLGEEPDEIFFRYHLRLANDWAPQNGGKLPGIAGTYGRAGWGGRKVDGTDGWSARGLFKGQQDGLTPVGFYCYHIDMRGRYGSNWLWNGSGFNGLQNNRWYCIEQHVKLNTPDRPDGVMKAWVDGDLVFEKSDVRMRSTPELKIETVWINVYLGGTWTAQQNQHLFIDDVIISDERIPFAP